MKKKILYLILFNVFIFNACDRTMYYDYFIINNCIEEISVNILDYKDKHSHVYVNAYQTGFIYHGEDFSTLEEGIIVHFFKNIKIVKNGVSSKVNYIDKELQIFVSTSHDHADVYLTVNPEDFEDE
jgi:hypothetical protein